MSNLQVGDIAPDFSLPSNGGNTVSLNDFKGKKLIVFFYPRDNTPGCTKEACGFNSLLPDFSKINVRVIGVSKDSLKSHDKFATKFDLSFPLLSDEDGTMCEDYGVWKEKSMYGKKYMGIERSTFLIDENGKIAAAWSKVKVPGHVEEVFDKLTKTQNAA